MSIAKKYGEIDFGEINNNAITQFSVSFETYFNSEDPSVKYDFLREFGSFKFGEINNLLLIDFEGALIRFFLDT
jgi:hypothetical protein